MMAGEIRDCLPPDRNPRKPKLVLPRGSIENLARGAAAVALGVLVYDCAGADLCEAAAVRLTSVHLEHPKGHVMFFPRYKHRSDRSLDWMRIGPTKGRYASARRAASSAFLASQSS